MVGTYNIVRKRSSDTRILESKMELRHTFREAKNTLQIGDKLSQGCSSVALCVPGTHKVLRLIHSTGHGRKDWNSLLNQ